jgi:hypothetical protein
MEVATTASRQRKRFVEGGTPRQGGRKDLTPGREKRDLTPRRKGFEFEKLWVSAGKPALFRTRARGRANLPAVALVELAERMDYSQVPFVQLSVFFPTLSNLCSAILENRSIFGRFLSCTPLRRHAETAMALVAATPR